MAIVHELSRLVQQRQLLRVSELEQDLAVRESRVEHLKAVFEFLQDTSVTTMDKLRLVALYAIRYACVGFYCVLLLLLALMLLVFLMLLVGMVARAHRCKNSFSAKRLNGFSATKAMQALKRSRKS